MRKLPDADPFQPCKTRIRISHEDGGDAVGDWLPIPERPAAYVKDGLGSRRVYRGNLRCVVVEGIDIIHLDVNRQVYRRGTELPLPASDERWMPEGSTARSRAGRCSAGGRSGGRGGRSSCVGCLPRG